MKVKKSVTETQQKEVGKRLLAAMDQMATEAAKNGITDADIDKLLVEV